METGDWIAVRARQGGVGRNASGRQHVPLQWLALQRRGAVDLPYWYHHARQGCVPAAQCAVCYPICPSSSAR